MGFQEFLEFLQLVDCIEKVTGVISRGGTRCL